MTDAELQTAIDKVVVQAAASGPLRDLATRHLETLYKVQAMRAMQLHAPGVRPGAIVEVK
jgi:hypothetical protein